MPFLPLYAEAENIYKFVLGIISFQEIKLYKRDPNIMNHPNISLLYMMEANKKLIELLESLPQKNNEKLMMRINNMGDHSIKFLFEVMFFLINIINEEVNRENLNINSLEEFTRSLLSEYKRTEKKKIELILDVCIMDLFSSSFSR